MLVPDFGSAGRPGYFRKYGRDGSCLDKGFEKNSRTTLESEDT